MTSSKQSEKQYVSTNNPHTDLTTVSTHKQTGQADGSTISKLSKQMADGRWQNRQEINEQRGKMSEQTRYQNKQAH